MKKSYQVLLEGVYTGKTFLIIKLTGYVKSYNMYPYLEILLMSTKIHTCKSYHQKLPPSSKATSNVPAECAGYVTLPLKLTD